MEITARRFLCIIRENMIWTETMACSMALSWTRMHWLGSYFIRKLSTITHNNSVKMWLAIDTYFNQSITDQLRLLLPLLHPFNNLFSKTTWISRYQKGKTSLDLKRGKRWWGLGMQWHQLDHMQTICTSLQRDNQPHQHPITQFFTGRMLFLMPNQQSQSNGGLMPTLISTLQISQSINNVISLKVYSGK